MKFVTVLEVLESIASNLDVSEAERASSLRLGDEVVQFHDPAAPSPFNGKTMGNLREDVIAGLARSFARAYQLSRSAALLENALHHEETSQPRLFDLRQTGLPRLNTSAITELRPILFGVAKFEHRLVKALSNGKLRGFPSHGGPGATGVNPDDWKSNPNDDETVNNLFFIREDIQRLLRDSGILYRPMRDAFTGQVIDANDLSEVIETAVNDEGSKVVAGNVREPLKPRKDDLSNILLRALKEAVCKGTTVDRQLCATEAFTIIHSWVDSGQYLNVLDFDGSGALCYRGKPVSRRSFHARVKRMWDSAEPLLQEEEAAIKSQPPHGRKFTAG